MSVTIEHIESLNGTIIRLLKYSEIDPQKFNLDLFGVNESGKFRSFKSPKRRAEFYFTRFLWKQFNVSEDIHYNSKGRPFLERGHISISHSRDVVVIAYNLHHAVGVDVEYHSPKLRKIQHKFISEADHKLADLSNDKVLTVIWSIKEAVYKMESIEGLSFKENIHVELSNSEVLVNVVKGPEIHHYTFQMIEYNDFVVTFCSHADLNGTSLY